MRAQLKVTEISTNAVLVNVSGTQTSVLSHPQFKNLCNNNPMLPSVYKIELYRDTTNTWVTCKVMRHRDGSYRGLQLLSQAPTGQATTQPFNRGSGILDATNQFRPRIESVLSRWESGNHNLTTMEDAMAILRDLRTRHII